MILNVKSPGWVPVQPTTTTPTKTATSPTNNTTTLKAITKINQFLKIVQCSMAITSMKPLSLLQYICDN